jgi:hypothetical protein
MRAAAAVCGDPAALPVGGVCSVNGSLIAVGRPYCAPCLCLFRIGLRFGSGTLHRSLSWVFVFVFVYVLAEVVSYRHE